MLVTMSTIARFKLPSLLVLLAVPLPVNGLRAESWKSVVIDGIPHVRQKPDFCGEACVAMALQKLNVDADQDWVFDNSGLSPLRGRGCYTKELTEATQRIGFRTGPVWNYIRAKQADEDLQRQFAALHQDLTSGIPSVVCTRYNAAPQSSEHFRLIVGYDQKTDEVIYHEPAVDAAGYQRMKRATLFELWPLKYEKERWLTIRLRLEPAKLKKPAKSTVFTDADYAQHIRKLKSKLPHNGFHIVIQRPFVVVGDEEAQVVKHRAEHTVKWTVDRIKQDYFQRDPHDIIDIWLFKDRASYEKHATSLFGRKPTTPFGYYSPTHRALVMNISTGGGTLVHEIVHPFMASNFPACPSWFNEGLASLYEQSRDRDGHIVGLTNWRLRGLQGAIDDDGVPSFEQLCSTTTNEFYNEDPGTNYSQARYLCYYLQEHDLLVKYYHAFRRSARSDPTGYQTLKRVLGESDMDAFKSKWQKYVMNLRF